MRKLLLLGSLLATMSGQAQETAKTTYYWPGERVTELTSGTQYFIYNTAQANGDRSWFIYSDGSALKTTNESPLSFITAENKYLFTTNKPESLIDPTHWYLNCIHGIVGHGGQTNNTEARDIYIARWFGNENITKGTAKSEDEQGVAQDPNSVDTKVWAITSEPGKITDTGQNYAWNGDAVTVDNKDELWTRWSEAHPYAFYTVQSAEFTPTAVETAQNAFGRNGTVATLAYKLQKAFGLVRSGDQYFSNYPETAEAEHSSYANLVDGNDESYFHSSWSAAGSDTEPKHFLRAELPEAQKEFYFVTKRRIKNTNGTDNNNNRPTSMLIEGSNEADGPYTEIATVEGLPTDGNEYYYFSDKISSATAYKYIRFTPSGMRTPEQETRFFTYSEFYVIKASDESAIAMTNLKAAYTKENIANTTNYSAADFDSQYTAAGTAFTTAQEAIDEACKHTLISVDENREELGRTEITAIYDEATELPSYDFYAPASTTTEGCTIDGNNIVISINAPKEVTVQYTNKYFKTSKVVDGQFVDATWYRLGIHNNLNRTYLKYHEGDNTIIDLIGSAAISYDDSQLWCFTGSVKEGFKIYNKQAGASLSISYSTAYKPGSHDNHAIMGDANAQEAIWKIAKSSAGESELSNGFCFKTEHATDGKIYLNQRGTYMSYWDNNGNGSTFVVFDAIEDEAPYNLAVEKAKQYQIGTGLGQFTDQDGNFSTILAKAEEGMPEDLTERIELMNQLTEAINTLVINQPEPGKFYRIKGASGKYISSETVETETSVNNKPAIVYRLKLTDATDKTTVLFLSEDNRITTEKMQNMSRAGVHLQGLGGKYNFKAHKEIGKYVITPTESPEGAIGGTSNNPLYDHSATTGAVDQVQNANDAKCAWTLEEVIEEDNQPTFSRTIGDAGYATLGAPVALNIPEGVKAYTVTVNEDNTEATLHEVTKTIPAGCGVVLKKTGGNGTYNFTFAAGADAIENNKLVPLYTETTLDTEINAYVLAKKNEVLGFYQLDSNNRTIGANKAYLVLDPKASYIRSITIGGPTTGIEETVANGNEAEEYYDLQGRRVLNPTKGIYVTKSGKKVIFNK